MSLEKHFAQSCLQAGFEARKAVPVYPSVDRTTLFIGSTISAFKELLRSDESQVPAVYAIQPCLRTQNTGSILSESDPEYLSYFTMLGAMCSVQDFDAKVVLDILEYYSPLTGRLMVRTSKDLYGAMWEDMYTMAPQVEYDTRPSSYYHWGYGEADLSGEGATLAFRQSSGEYLDVGNILLVRRNNEPVAVEFGFGVETLAARATSQTSPFSCSPLYKRLGLGLSNFEKKIGDALISAYVMSVHGVPLKGSKQTAVLRKTFRHVCFLVAAYDGDLHSGRIQQLARQLDTNHEWNQRVQMICDRVQASIDSYHLAVRHIQKHTHDESHLKRKMEDYRKRYNIPEEWVKLNRVL